MIKLNKIKKSFFSITKIKDFGKKGFVWYLFQQEMIFFMIGFAVGLILMIVWALGYISFLPSICQYKLF